MLTKRIALGMVICLLSGCTSFRTTALFRLDNDSVIPECRKCNKLKGLPVKLKVPSHVRVVIYEQQLILANSPDKKSELETTANTLAAKVKGLKSEIKAIISNEATAKLALKTAEETLQESTANLTKAKMDGDAGKIVQYTKEVERDTVAKAEAETMSTLAENRFKDELPKKTEELHVAEHEAALALANTEVGYTLVSFTPAQLVVETELEYTDKIFMVDFRRPAGGILDLKEASMDDEQYFAKIQADVTERTMEDVSTAIKTLQGPLTKKPDTNVATPTSAATADDEQPDDINFQKSVVAFKRFDISEPGWEQCMMDFVNLRLGTSYSTSDAEYISDATSQANQNSGYVNSESIPPAYLMPIDDGSPQTGDFSRIEQLESDRNVPAVPFVAGPNTNRYK